MLFKKNDKPRFLVPVCLVLAMTLLLGACGEDEKQAAAAVQWLSAYTKDYPRYKEWIATNIAVDDIGRVVMDVVVPDQGLVD
ncbi:MAG: hypothetical protein ISR45_09160, partial [Rhodospirillales bacterium]|nr:hypothetical protein [Rhodospirillales bacterium]